MVIIDYKPEFKRIVSKIKDKQVKIRIKKLIAKIIKNPEIWKLMKYSRKGTRELYLKPFRISYLYNENDNLVVFFLLYHKDEQ